MLPAVVDCSAEQPSAADQPTFQSVEELRCHSACLFFCLCSVSVSAVCLSVQREERKVRGVSRGRHRDRTLSPPTKDPSATERRTTRRRAPAAVNPPGVHMERVSRNADTGTLVPMERRKHFRHVWY